MNRLLLLSCLVLCACPGPTAPDAGGTGGGSDEFLFDVSGTAAMYPEGADMLADAGQSTSVAGLTLRVEEPLKVALNDPLGQFSSKTLDATGAFSASMISTDLVNLGVAAGVVDDAGTRAVRSATVLWDVAFEGKKPDKNITNAKAWVLPKVLHDALDTAIGDTKIMTVASGKHRLVDSGCIIGRVVDAMGKPVSGVTITPTTASLASHFFYPTADFTSTGTTTSATGIFVFIHDGGDNVVQFSFDVMGATGYKRRSAGAAKDACLVTTVYPGTTAP